MGLLRDGRLETLWHTVADQPLTAAGESAPAEIRKVATRRTFGTSLDAFERVG
ncbi:hypothetical protein ACFW16_00640 [Inquilinus sp. NPDC058860]|uniref:hypothetical protein n=1 Tax=Inquilinus sp. NPDC058860 TaxID=3346652 RepID=UPI00367C6296